jgi:hypothetical protein
MKKVILFCIIGLLLVSGINVTATIQDKTNKIVLDKPSNDGTEYWALLVGCNVFQYAPDASLPGNDRATIELKNTLLVSGNWQENHIKVLTGEDATKRNILKGLKWLDDMDDDDDVCFFYLSTHGTIEKDMYPKDEYDWLDEYALPYDTYIKLPILGIRSFRWNLLRDDEFNRRFNNLESKGIFALFDTCYSGGFNDPMAPLGLQSVLQHLYIEKIAAKHRMNNLEETLSGTGRVIMMSCEEHAISQGTCFTYSVIEAMQGKCDINNDSICTGEEIFAYASNKTTAWLRDYKNWEQYPQLVDTYSGDIPITMKNLPPNESKMLLDTPIGNISQEYHNLITANDPENERIQYHIDWDDNQKEVTPLYDSAANVSISHTWTTEGTYNIWIESEDESHAMLYQFGLPYHYTVIMCGENHVDQYQTKIYQPEGFYDSMIYNADPTTQCMQAQSFTPTLPTLTKVDIWVGIGSLYNVVNNITYSLRLSIRSTLNGSDLTTASAVIPIQNLSYNTPPGWTTFDFPDITVTPGNTYYIVCRQDHQDYESLSYWLYGDPDYPSYPNHDEDPYHSGQAYQSTDGGITWTLQTEYADDFCFVTYGG